MNRHLFLILLTGFSFLVGCASAPRASEERVSGLSDTDKVKQIAVEPKARASFFQAERAFRAQDYKQAAQSYAAIQKKFPGTQAAMLASYRLGTIHYYTSDYVRASQEFRDFLRRHPQTTLRFDVVYNYAASEFQQGNYPNAKQILNWLSPSEVQAQGPARSEVVFQLAVQTANAMGDHAAAVVATASHLQLPVTENKRALLQNAVDQHLGLINDRTELQALLAQVNEPTTQSKISQRLSALSAPATSTLPAYAGAIGGERPQSAATLGTNSSGDTRHIGVILPLSGKSAAYGERALEGILLAAQVFGQGASERYQVFVEDSESSPAVASQAVDRLVRDHQVMAILGPLSWTEAVAVSERSQELGVPNISLTSKEGLSKRSAYTFQNALTPRVQLEELVKFAIQQRQMNRFAIVAPQNSFGSDMAQEFWTLVEQNGGIVVGYETYDADTQDFQDSIRSLTGLSDPKMRRTENAALAKFQKEQETKTGRASKSRLPPIVDFDGIFIPDHPGAVAQIAASLAYFDVSKVTLLGTTEWNSDQLYKRGGRLVEGALFPGAITLSSRNPRTRDFIREFAENYGQVPDTLAAQSFEAMQLVSAALRRSGSSGRNDLVSALMEMQNFESPLGKLSFDSTRVALRNLPVLSLLPGGNIVQQ
jgi:ABC-type branched-subunit amino acid transport system substrate-binding protein/TolA-binding protein